jgi:chitin disaccharide deacetylase
VKTIQLIVNADDFGLSEEVNEAVIRAARMGVLTSCSLMVGAPAFEHAVRLAKQTPGLAVGIHLTTVCGQSVLPPDQIPSLVDSQGNFSYNPVTAGLKYFFSRRTRQELWKELSSQFEKFLASGLSCSHIDGHQHFHVHPVIFDQAVRLGKRHGIRRMRVPLDDLNLALHFNPRRSLQKMILGAIFALLCSRMKQRLEREKFLYTDRVYGFFETGRMSTSYFLFLLRQLKAGSSEIYFHPAYFQTSSPLIKEEYQSLVEYNALVDNQVCQRIREGGIRLSTYRDLVPS